MAYDASVYATMSGGSLHSRLSTACSDQQSLAAEFSGLSVKGDPRGRPEKGVKHYIDSLMLDHEQSSAHVSKLFDNRIKALTTIIDNIRETAAKTEKELKTTITVLAERVKSLEDQLKERPPPSKPTQQKEPEAGIIGKVYTPIDTKQGSDEVGDKPVPWHKAKVLTDHMCNGDRYRQQGIHGFTWQISNYEAKIYNAQYGAQDYWESEEFSISSYCFKLYIYPGGGGNLGNQLGVYFALLQGETDEMLQWPLTRNGIFMIKSTKKDQPQISNRIHRDADRPLHRVMPGSPPPNPVGVRNWKENNTVKGYLVNGALNLTFLLPDKEPL